MSKVKRTQLRLRVPTLGVLSEWMLANELTQVNQGTRERSGQWPRARLTAPTASPAVVSRRRLVRHLQRVSHHQVSLLLKELLAVPLLLRNLTLFGQILLPSGQIYNLGLFALRRFVQLVRLTPGPDSRQHGLPDLLLQVIVRLLLIVQLLLRQVLFVMCLRADDSALQHRMTQRQRGGLSPT